MDNVAISHSIGYCKVQRKTRTMRYFLRGTSGPEDIKLFFMLNSTEHEIFPAQKC